MRFKYVGLMMMWYRYTKQPFIYQRPIVSTVFRKCKFHNVFPDHFYRLLQVIGNTSDPTAATTEEFGKFWRELASRFVHNEKVIFGINNEPHDMVRSHATSFPQVKA